MSVGELDLDESAELSDDNTAMLSLVARSFNKCSNSCCCVLFSCLSWQQANKNQCQLRAIENAKNMYGRCGRKVNITYTRSN
jgi:hypothetical protein